VEVSGVVGRYISISIKSEGLDNFRNMHHFIRLSIKGRLCLLFLVVVVMSGERRTRVEFGVIPVSPLLL
jgi:hypothetical protein